MNQPSITSQITQALRAANQNKTATAETCKLLQITPEDLLHLQFRAALTFLDRHLGLPPDDKQALMRSPEYFGWFATEWNKADAYLRNDRQSWLAIDMQKTAHDRHDIHQTGIFYRFEYKKISVWNDPKLILAARKEPVNAI